MSITLDDLTRLMPSDWRKWACYAAQTIPLNYKVMIRFHLKQLIADAEFEQARRITLDEIAKETGIHRTTLSKIANQRGYNTTTKNIGLLCKYFACEVAQLVEYLPDTN